MAGHLRCIRVACFLFITVATCKADQEKPENNLLTEELYFLSHKIGDNTTNEEFYKNNEIENEYWERILSEKDFTISKPIDIIITTIYGIITTVGLAANGLVFFVIFGGKEIGK